MYAYVYWGLDTNTRGYLPSEYLFSAQLPREHAPPELLPCRSGVMWSWGSVHGVGVQIPNTNGYIYIVLVSIAISYLLHVANLAADVSSLLIPARTSNRESGSIWSDWSESSHESSLNRHRRNSLKFNCPFRSGVTQKSNSGSKEWYDKVHLRIRDWKDEAKLTNILYDSNAV